MAAAKRKSIAKLCLALGLFILAGFFVRRIAWALRCPLPLFSADQPDLHRSGDGLGLFHISQDFAPL